MTSNTEQPPKRWGRSSWITVFLVSALLILLAIASYQYLRESSQKAAVANNVRHLMMSMKIFANDVGGYYPFGLSKWPTANAGFRELAKEECLETEEPLGSLSSPFKPDGDMGSRFAKFAEPGECHWMVIQDSTTSNAGNEPLVFDNAINATWPPRWKANADGQEVRGRTLFGNRIVIGFNDLTIRFLKLEQSGGDLVLPETDPPYFHPLRGTPKIADLEEKR